MEKLFRKVSLVLALVLLLMVESRAQQIPHYSQYTLNPLLLNPAISGTDNYLDVRAGYRNQWVGLEGAPTSYYLSGHMSLGKLDYNSTPTTFRPQSFSKTKSRAQWKPQHKSTLQKTRAHHGLGALIQVDQAAGLKRTDAQLLYAYHLPLSANVKLAAGIAAGVTQYGLNWEHLSFTNPGDPVTSANDYRKTRPNLGVGLMAYGDRFYAGVSLAQILPAPFSFRASGPGQTPASQQRHLFAHGGYRFAAGRQFSVLPSLVLKYASPSPLSFDATAKVYYRDQFWLGGTYRHHDAAVAMAGFQLKQRLHLGYAYDFTTSALGTVSHGSHEVVLGLMLRNTRGVFSPSQYW
ncbi:type IX secretion system membrane protein PorP/SprF [Nibribacter ruber]|uniref:Type IX secretion system membrane protein PorP/SprF n=1 Tax=Nibribacter ruber TaxID=2698458 RepID=A0A6P1NUK2_9BACT|nr:type IX secretion system membrane protein PorP/SprF [Nibribacter ruber]QHL87536.1 type IX secretion system membrane protein PorP/SprF [Nibribacter ruber]